MTRLYVIVILVFGLLAFGGWALAQPELPDAKASPEGGPFVVSTGGENIVLLETGSGKSWVLYHCDDDHNVWLPVERIDSLQGGDDWLNMEQTLYTTKHPQQAREQNEQNNYRKLIRHLRQEIRHAEQERAKAQN